MSTDLFFAKQESKWREEGFSFVTTTYVQDVVTITSLQLPRQPYLRLSQSDN